MGLQERLKWWLIRHWALGYRLASRVEALLHPENVTEIEESSRFFSRFVDPGGLCFDLGANHGVRSEAFLRLGARVVAVEPHPRCVERLRARFGHQNRFHLVAKAAGAHEHQGTLHLGKQDGISTLAENWVETAQATPEFSFLCWEGTHEVPVTTLDSLIAEHGVPDFCKIDVEGYELEVLSGLNQPLPLVSFEYVHGRSDWAVECVDRLQQLGAYRFNLSELESMEFLFENWLSADEVREVLVDRYSKPEVGYGDVYACLVEEPE